MKRYYSKTTGNCYLEGINTEIPEDAIEIEDDRYDSVIKNPDLAKVRSHDENGLPILIDQPPTSIDELIAQATSERNVRLVIATASIAPLQDAVDLDESTVDEMALLKSWKQYRVAEYRVDLAADRADWPSPPG